ncbi:MAG TPA: DUF1569 domain-containing protein [Thermoanaerobaculia bacterium]
MKSLAIPEGLSDLVDRLGKLRPDTQRRWGTLTPGEMLCHLTDVSASVLSQRNSGRDRSRPILKSFFLYLPLPWPRSVKTPVRLDPHAEGTRPVDFEEDRRRAVEGLRALASAQSFPAVHFVFGRMKTREWHRWAYRHTDHHLKQFGL